MENQIVTLIIGAIMGLSSGMFGIGGALIGTPLLKIFMGMSPILALATPLPAAIPSAFSGSIAYFRKGLIDFRLSAQILAGAILTTLLGTYCTTLVSGSVLMITTGIVLLWVGISFFIRGWLNREAVIEENFVPPLKIIILIGLLSGFLSGFLAIGGGIIMVPFLTRFAKISIKKALAISLFCVAIIAIPASIGHFQLGHIDVPIMLILAVVVIPFSFIGAKIAISLKNQTLERIYGTFIMIFALYFLWKHS